MMSLGGKDSVRIDKSDDRIEINASILILELTPTNKELKEPWLICSLSFTRGEDVPFIQAVKPGENVDEAPILNEESIEIDDKSGAIDDHDPTAATESNKLLEDVNSLFKEVIDGIPDLVGGVDELKTKLVQTLTYNVSPQETEVGNTSRPTPFDDSMKLNYFKGDQNNCYYQESQQGLLQTLNVFEPELPPDVSCFNAIMWIEPHCDANSKDNAEMKETMDVDIEDGKYCLDDMSIGFEEDTSNGEIKVTLYQEDHKALCNKMDVAIDGKTLVTETSPVIKTRVVDSFGWSCYGALDHRMQIEHNKAHCCKPYWLVVFLFTMQMRKRGSVPWTDVDMVYFPLNEYLNAWALVDLLSLFLDKIGVLKSKGLLVGEYKIAYQFEEKVPHRGAVYEDCEV
ncbi:hypothetical protein Tco_1262848 [Tanacetum coccineum]